jgi:hypothetical protein
MNTPQGAVSVVNPQGTEETGADRLAAPAIPLDWIKNYTGKLLEYAGQLPEYSPMRTAALLRVDNIMDMVKAWKGIR